MAAATTAAAIAALEASIASTRAYLARCGSNYAYADVRDRESAAESLWNDETKLAALQGPDAVRALNLKRDPPLTKEEERARFNAQIKADYAEMEKKRNARIAAEAARLQFASAADEAAYWARLWAAHDARRAAATK